MSATESYFSDIILCFSVKALKALNNALGLIKTPRVQAVYVVVQFYPWFRFHFLLFKTNYHTLPYPKTKENKI